MKVATIFAYYIQLMRCVRFGVGSTYLLQLRFINVKCELFSLMAGMLHVWAIETGCSGLRIRPPAAI